MKRLTRAMLTVGLFAVGASWLWAENAGLALANGESAWLYYSVDPALAAGAPAARAGSDVFRALDRVKFAALPPGASLRIDGLAPGAHAVIGFWATENSIIYGSFSLDLTLGDGQVKTFTLKKTAAMASLENKTATVASVKDTLPDTPIVIDNAYADWDAYPAIAAFAPTFSPPRFTLQTKEGERELPLRNSGYWGKGGTQLLTAKALLRGDAAYFYFSAAAPFAPGLSVFLYLFGDRQTADLNIYTIEIPETDQTGSGPVLLWQRGVKDPLTIGQFRSSSFYLEASLDLAKLPAALRDNLVGKYSFDLKTNFFDGAQGAHEEFYFDTIDFTDVYR